MKNLKWKVKYLEKKVIFDKAHLREQIIFFNYQITNTPYLAAKLIISGFIVGFLLAPIRNIRLKLAFTRLLAFFNTLKLTSRYLASFT